ncbi:MAG: HEAT repeat domain-containing protein [Desulfobacterales bacterium]|nr:HEAT repeat domain-containing protein [Desulfobacterales bacterium]
MANPDIQEKAVEAMIATNAAIQKIRFYPTSSASTRNSIDEAYQAIQTVFEQESLFIMTISERGFIVCEQLLAEKDQNRLQVKAFLELLSSFGIYQLTFRKRLDQEIFTAFLEILSKAPELVEKQGGLQKLAAEQKLSDIFLNQDQQVPTDDKENQNQGVNRKNFAVAVNTLNDFLEGENKNKVSEILASSIIKKDDNFISMVLTQKIKNELGQAIFDNIITQTDREKFKNLLSEIKRMNNDAQSDEGIIKPSDIESIKSAYQSMINSDKGAQFKKKDEDEKVYFKAQLNSILKGDTEVLKNRQVMDSVPGAVEQFFARGKGKTAEAIIEKLGDGLLSDDPDIRAEISEAVTEIAKKLFSKDRLDIMHRLSLRLAKWIRLETSVTPAGEAIYIHLQNLAKILIRHNRLSDCYHILETFNLIYCGRIKKDEKLEALAGSALKNLSKDGILDPVLKEFRTNENNKRVQAVESLTKLGAATVDPLLFVLRESDDKSERSRILKVVSDIGEPSVPALTEQISQDQPWYYIRNLVLLFGRVGNETHLQAIQPFLDYEDLRVRREALNSIFKIGGKKSEQMLLGALPEAEDRLKIRIVSMLGALKCRDAVLPLMKLLESMTDIAAEHREEMAEKICTSFGNIGSREAILALSDIFEEKKKSLLDKKSYNEKLKAAAASALAMKTNKK